MATQGNGLMAIATAQDGISLRSRPEPSRGVRPRLLIVGGCDVHFRIELMRALADRFEIAAAGSEPMLNDQFTAAGFPYYFYPLGRGVTPIGDLVSVMRLRAIFRNYAPDIVHTFATKPGVWGRIAARMAGVPVIIGTLPGLGSLYTNSSVIGTTARWMYERLQKHAAACSDMTIFQNGDDLAQFRNGGLVTEVTSMVIPGSGVSTRHFDRHAVSAEERADTEAELRRAPGRLVVTMVSRLIRPKGVMEFAAAADSVRSRCPEAEFILVGPDDQESVDALTSDERARLNRSVRWLGVRTDIRAILSVTDLFVLPSYYREGVPRVLLEAAAMGLPLVTTRMPGCADVVADGENGLLVPTQDADALAAAIIKLAESPDLRRRFGAASRRIACDRFDLAVVAEQTAVLYNAILRRSAQPSLS